jgi:TonB family protein
MLVINFIPTDENGTTSVYTKSRGTEPKYKGGLQAFYEYLGRKIIYPKDDREKNVQGNVIMSFVVEKDGKISDIKILRSVSYDIDQEATRVVGNSPNWVPGTQFGRPVRVVYTIPSKLCFDRRLIYLAAG